MTSADSVVSSVASITASKTLGDPEVEDDVLQTLLRSFGATGGRIYSLDLAKSIYVSLAGRSRTGTPASFDARRLRSPENWGALETAAATGVVQVSNEPTSWAARGGTHTYGSRMVLPILRSHTVVGLVDLHCDQAGAFTQWVSERMMPEAELAVQQLANLYEARSVHNILEQTALFRVALDQPETIAQANLMRFVGQSSGMQYVALRRYDPGSGSLVCVETSGFDRAINRQAMTLTDLAGRYPSFRHVVDTKTHWIAPSLDRPEYHALRNRPELKDVRSFVACPVLIGEDLWGVLSFAAAVPYDYSTLEVYSLRALANLTGAALDAAQASESARETRYDDGRLMQAVLSNEVVTATRHQMYDQLAIVGASRSAFLEVVHALESGRSTRLTKADIDHLAFHARVLDVALMEMNKIIETIKFTQGALSGAQERVSVVDAWNRAAEPFAFRAKRSGLQKIPRPDMPEDIAILGSPDWLRIVFMHLLLNTFDAFDRKLSSGRPEVSLRVRTRSQQRIVLRYVDNAGGILSGSLMRKGEPANDDPRRAIFERYVSSKSSGTGLGLASCRAALGTMNASIDLVDWRRGITFDLDLAAYE